VTSTLFGDRRRTLLLVALSLVGIGLTLRAEQASEARANRLHRNDALAEAAAIYDQQVIDDPAAADLRYNLGTTLLRLGEPGAGTELAAGTDTDDERLRVHALYNLGLWTLIQSIMASTTDSVLFHAANAVEMNKSALRLDPGHLDARWNLALAQQILVNSTPEQGLMDPGDIAGPDNIGERMETDSSLDLANREGLEEASPTGEAEALAGEDVEALSVLEASEILGTSHLDPSTLMTKLLNREGRARRRQGIFVNGPMW
jgi:tetratricopeptide (TPR) repeat protein